MIKITNKIDLDPLSKELSTRLTRPSYIIMSDETLETIRQQHPTQEPLGMTRRTSYKDLCGIPVATCNAVPYGFIDIKD